MIKMMMQLRKTRRRNIVTSYFHVILQRSHPVSRPVDKSAHIRCYNPLYSSSCSPVSRKDVQFSALQLESHGSKYVKSAKQTLCILVTEAIRDFNCRKFLSSCPLRLSSKQKGKLPIKSLFIDVRERGVFLPQREVKRPVMIT